MIYTFVAYAINNQHFAALCFHQLVFTPEQAPDSLSVQAPRDLPDLRVRRLRRPKVDFDDRRPKPPKA